MDSTSRHFGRVEPFDSPGRDWASHPAIKVEAQADPPTLTSQTSSELSLYENPLEGMLRFDPFGPVQMTF
jgi:hypothetical protein